MRPFDLEAAKRGEPVCTRSGDDVRILCTDGPARYVIVAIIDERSVASFSNKGFYYLNEEPNAWDLFMKADTPPSTGISQDAAQEMLALLDECITKRDKGLNWRNIDPYWKAPQGWVSRAKKAIAKAKGGTQ